MFKRPPIELEIDPRLERLSAQRKALEVRPEPLSQANKFHLTKLKEFEAKFGEELEARRREIDRRSKFGSDIPTDKATRSRFFQLLNTQRVLQQRADAEHRRSKLSTLEKPFVERGFFNYNPVRDARTVFGTTAYLKAVSTPQLYFKNPALVVPCLDRVVRKEVMFAKGHAGKAHRKRHRRGPFSMIRC